MRIHVIRDGEWIEYERSGECLGCGECCSRFNYSFKRTTATAKGPVGDGEDKDAGREKRRKWNDWAVENWEDKEIWVWWGPMEITPIDEPKCESFDPETNQCEKFSQDGWREICRKFPFRPEDLAGIENCGFSFEEVA